MSDFNTGKAALQFHDYAMELHYAILSNKKIKPPDLLELFSEEFNLF